MWPVSKQMILLSTLILPEVRSLHFLTCSFASLGKLCSAGLSRGLCCISQQENERVIGAWVIPQPQGESSGVFASGRKKMRLEGVTYKNIQLYILPHYIFCLSLQLLLCPYVTLHTQKAWPFVVRIQIKTKA